MNIKKYVGLILLFTFLIIPSISAVSIPRISTTEPVVFHNNPENGLYWDDLKIGKCSVPLFLHYRFIPYLLETGITVTGDNIERVEFYLDGLLVSSNIKEPFIYEFQPGMYLPCFGHSATLSAKVYLADGQTMTDNLTAYRLFP